MTPVTTSPSAAAVTAAAASLPQSAQTATAQLAQLLGQTVAARIVAAVDANTLRLAIPGGTIDVQTAVPLPPGTPVQLTVSGSSSNPQVVLTAGSGAVAAAATAAQSGQQPAVQATQTATGQSVSNQAQSGQSQAGTATGTTLSLAQLVGQNVSGRVIGVTDGSTLRLATQAGIVEIQSPVPLPVGSQVQLAVSGSASRPQLVLTAVGGGTIGGGTATAANVETTPIATPAQPAMPSGPSAAALSAATALARDATARQGGLAALYADLEALVSGQSASSQASSGQVLSVSLPSAASSSLSSQLAQVLASQSASQGATPSASVPAAMQPVIAAARQLLALRLDPGTGDGISAAAIKAALAQSGLIGELALASGQVAMSPGLTVTTALIALRTALKTLIDAEAEPAPAGSPAAASSSPASAPVSPRASTPMPPYRGAPTVAQAPTASSLPLNASPRAQADHLLARVDAALARQSLLQIAALPGGSSSALSHSSNETAKLLVDIPLATGQGTAVAQLLIEPDHNPKSGQQGETASIWRASFSIDVEPIGPVHVRIALSGERTSVTMTAERRASAEQLAAGLPMLQSSLRDAELEPGELRAQAGPADTPDAGPGLFVNLAS
jgi:hypothetical protein